METCRTTTRLIITGLAGSLLVAAVACGDDDAATGTAPAGPVTTSSPTTTPGTAVIDPGDGGNYQPGIVAADFVEAIDNPYLPLTVGSRWVYEGESDGESERIEIDVLARRKRVFGVAATVVRDRAYVEGELVEATFDWYAQDRDGNVWYLGEDTKEYEEGKVVSAAGSWEAGVDGALPGIVMPARPGVGLAYRQEYYAGEAEDMGEVIATGDTVTVTVGSFSDVITTRDWTPLEPEVIEEKSYAPGAGQISETKAAGGEGRLELVEYSPGG
jgi:hypothetical protein